MEPADHSKARAMFQPKRIAHRQDKIASLRSASAVNRGGYQSRSRDVENSEICLFVCHGDMRSETAAIGQAHRYRFRAPHEMVAGHKEAAIRVGHNPCAVHIPYDWKRSVGKPQSRAG